MVAAVGGWVVPADFSGAALEAGARGGCGLRPAIEMGVVWSQGGSVGSKTLDGVWFAAYSDDHLPVHVHGRYAGIEVLVEFADGECAWPAGRTRYVRARQSAPMWPTF